MKGQKLLEAPIPWYRKRLFWGVIIGILLLWGIVFYLSTFPQNRDLMTTFINISLAFGSGTFTFIGLATLGEIGRMSFTVLYCMLFFALLYKTFSREKVLILYPIAFISLFLVGTFSILQVISGLN